MERHNTSYDAINRGAENTLQRQRDVNYRDLLIHTAVNKTVYSENRDRPQGITERLAVTKWMQAVLLELGCGQQLAGASTMFNTKAVLALASNPFPDSSNIMSVADFRTIIEQKLEQAMRNEQQVNDANISQGKASSNPNNSKMNKVLDSQFGRISRLQKRLYCLTPLAWNALSDAFDIAQEVFQEEQIDIRKFMNPDFRRSQDSFTLSRRELITLFSRHPLVSYQINRCAGAILQSSLNLRDGAYSGIRKLNANDSRCIAYVLQLKASLRQHSTDIEGMLHNVIRQPISNLEYYLDITSPIVAQPLEVFGEDDDETPPSSADEEEEKEEESDGKEEIRHSDKPPASKTETTKRRFGMFGDEIVRYITINGEQVRLDEII